MWTIIRLAAAFAAAMLLWPSVPAQAQTPPWTGQACELNAHCPARMRCETTALWLKRCRANFCNSDSDCPGQLCLQGMCQGGCRLPSDCRRGFACDRSGGVAFGRCRSTGASRAPPGASLAGEGQACGAGAGPSGKQRGCRSPLACVDRRCVLPAR